jgi:hypothetical protein
LYFRDPNGHNIELLTRLYGHKIRNSQIDENR